MNDKLEQRTCTKRVIWKRHPHEIMAGNDQARTDLKLLATKCELTKRATCFPFCLRNIKLKYKMLQI